MRTGDLAAWLLLAGLLSATTGTADARGLQVSPVSLTFAPGEHGQALWLTNSGEQPLHAQVRVYRWHQSNGEDELEPTRDLVATPPMIEVPPGQSQLVRVVRPGPPVGTTDVEASYRLKINELPIQHPDESGVDFIMEYSLPVFLETVDAARPQLRWTVVAGTAGTRLRVANTGNSRARLSEVSVVDASDRTHEVAGGLMGYVLPGAIMEWEIPSGAAAALASGGHLRASINGEGVDSVALADTPG